jgi:type I restriction enzyme M protein
MMEYTKPLESAVRVKINTWLMNKGWNLDENSPECNCFTERARTINENDKLRGNKPDYVLYSSDGFYPIAIIEAKRPGEKMELALKQAADKYARPLGVDIVYISDGIFIQAFHISDGNFLYFNSELVTEFLPEKRLLQFVENGSNLYSERKISHTRVELIKIFGEANKILRKDGLSEGKERFTEFSNLLFLKLINDIENEKEERGASRDVAERYCWDYFKDKQADELLDYINDIVLARLNRSYGKAGLMIDNKLKINKSTNLKAIIDKISELGDLLDSGSDVKGDAFEFFLKKSISVGDDLGEYFTPRHIVKLMVELSDLKFQEKIYDPCCGTGGFLIEAFRNIKGKCKMSDENMRILEEETVYGREISNTAKIAKMNMIIIGDGHSNVKQMDCLEYPVKGEYDVVLSNYAFSQTTDYGHLYGFSTSDANPAFLRHIFDSLNDTGRAAVIVPEGLLFDTKQEYVNLRKLLVETADVFAIIRLNPFVFKPYAGQPTSIVFFRKGSRTKDVWFFDVENDGYIKTNSIKGRKKCMEDDLISLRHLWKDRKTTPKSFSVLKNEVAAQGYDLSFGKYIRRDASANKTVPLESLVKDGRIIIGFTPPRNEDANWIGGKNIWVKISDITDSMYIEDSEEYITDISAKPSKLLPEGTLLFSFKLSIGKVAITRKPMYTNEAIAGLIVDDPIVRKYLYYILPALDYTTNRAAKGETLNKKTLGEIEIPFDMDKAAALVKSLDAYEKKRAAHKKSLAIIDADMKDLIKNHV